MVGARFFLLTRGSLRPQDENIHGLELKLRTAEAARERAEARCGGALEEMERMKTDMVTLAAQLQESEEVRRLVG